MSSHHDGQVSDKPFRTVLGKYCDMTALLIILSNQCAGNAAYLIGSLLPGQFMKNTINGLPEEDRVGFSCFPVVQHFERGFNVHERILVIVILSTLNANLLPFC